MTTNFRLALIGCAGLGLAILAAPMRAQDPALQDDFKRNARRAAPRDAFPVFDDPPMVDVATADPLLRPDDWVIGVEVGGEAKAYPVAVMGVHELGNDTCGGVPIAVSW